ncbi:MAG: nicotinate-nucleotide adenylyltransferase [Pirellulales bacterium]|nr:nicotinate-nucleotide adenylyltransferase [Pirellulales bacterium]
MRLGILGGTFDPIHNGHLLLAECCREQCRLDEVWFLPSAVAPHKRDRRPTDAEHRLAMLELATAGNPAFSICRREIDRGGVNYSVDTLAYLRAEDPTRELFFLMGADMLFDLPQWRDASRVCELAVPVAVSRPGVVPVDFDHLREVAGPERIELIRRHRAEMPQIDISAGELRRLVSLGRSIRYRVPPAVERYIETHGLYRE